MEPSSALPALKRTTFFALILIGAPVCGLRPARAFLREIPNVPKPTSVTLSPLRRDRSMLPTSASIAFAAEAYVIAASLATLSISAVLFIDSPPLWASTFWREIRGTRTLESGRQIPCALRECQYTECLGEVGARGVVEGCRAAAANIVREPVAD